MFDRSQRNRRIIRQAIRRPLSLKNIRISHRRPVHPNNNRRINRRTHNSQLPAIILLILPNVTMRQHSSHSTLHKNSLRNISRSRLLRSQLIRQINIQLRSRNITTPRTLLRARRSLTINRIMRPHKERLSARLTDSIISRFKIKSPQRRRRFLLKQHSRFER